MSDEGGQRPPPPPPPLPGTDGRPVRASFQMLLKVQALLMTMTDEEKMALGHSETDLIADCEFAGATCSSTYVSLYSCRKYRARNCNSTARGKLDAGCYIRHISISVLFDLMTLILGHMLHCLCTKGSSHVNMSI